jgi:heptosyltransferase-2
LNIPALRALKETFTHARIFLAVDPDVKELIPGIPFIDEAIEWKRTKHSIFEKFGLINLLRTKKIDMAIMLNPSRELNIFTYLAGIPIRVGYDRKWGFLLTHRMEDKKYLGEKHEIEYNLELVGLVGAKTEDKTPSLTIDNNLINEFKAFDIKNQDNLIAIHPFTSDPLKQWPIGNFRELARRLIKEINIKVVIIGGKDEAARSLEYFGNLGSNLINMTGRTTLNQLAALLKVCKLLISGDSGPVHLASCVGTPVVAIFRNDIPGKNSIRWGPRSHGSVVIERPELSDITTEEIIAKIKEVLKCCSQV